MIVCSLPIFRLSDRTTGAITMRVPRRTNISNRLFWHTPVPTLRGLKAMWWCTRSTKQFVAQQHVPERAGAGEGMRYLLGWYKNPIFSSRQVSHLSSPGLDYTCTQQFSGKRFALFDPSCCPLSDTVKPTCKAYCRRTSSFFVHRYHSFSSSRGCSSGRHNSGWSRTRCGTCFRTYKWRGDSPVEKLGTTPCPTP